MVTKDHDPLVLFAVTVCQVTIRCMKQKRIPLNVDFEDYQRLKALSERTGIPASNLLRRAIGSWLNENEAELLKALGTKEGAIARNVCSLWVAPVTK
jgi:predicted DNA-binding protein